MNRATDHLTSAQIEDYVSKGHAAANGVYKGLEAHMEDCEPCLSRVLDAHRMHLGLLEGDRMTKTRYPDCPAESALQELAAGIGPLETAEATAQHAAHCGFCGPLLSRYLKEFSDDLETADTAILKQLETSKPGWQKKFVREQIGRSQETPERSFFARFWPGFATAAAAAAMAAVGIFVWVHRSNDLTQAQRLVASAYAERRTTEMRVPSAPYAGFQPIPVVKGNATGDDLESAPASLVQAEALVKQRGKSGDLNPQWLQVQGRIDLLQGSPKSIDAAVDMFEKALARNPGDPGLKVDLATAYFEKEMRADHERPVLIKTIDLLNNVIKNSATNTPLREAALFDLALAYEKSEMRDLAISTWQQYVNLDKTSEWNKEAQRHLDDLRNHAPPPRQQGYATPAYFLSHASDPDVLANLEEFQDFAVSTWLSPAVENPSSESGHAAAELARLLKKHHSDTWLQDFLARSTPADVLATKTLSAAFTHDLDDLHQQAIREARIAAAAFAQHHNFPGELRARFQEVYGLQRSLAGSDCLQRVDELWTDVSSTSYHWLQAQLALERAACANLVSDLQMAAISIETSRKLADKFHFPEFALRVVGVGAGMRRFRGQDSEAWKQTVQGLHTYWTGSYSWERLYQFYSVMRQCAKDEDFLHAARALSLQSIALVEQSAPSDASLRAMLYLRLANTLRAQNETALADMETNKATSLLKTVSDPTAQDYALWTQIEFAELELQQGNPDKSLAALMPVSGLLQTQNDFVKLDFFTVQGDIFLRLKKLDNAVIAYQAGVQVAERSLSAPPDEATQLNWVLATEDTYRGLTRSLLELGRDRDALSAWERFHGRSLKTRGGTGNPSRMSGSEAAFSYTPIPTADPPHLVYASFEDGLQVWLVKGSQIQSKWIPLKRDDLQKDVREFSKECSDPSLSLDKAQTLYTKILQPIVSDLPLSSTVSVELDEPMWGLTVEALRNGNGRYFGEEHPIIYTPGLLAENFLRQPSALSSRDPMLLIDASQAMAGAPLPGHTDEVTAVKLAFANTKTVGPSAISVTEIRQALAQSFEFHFSGHGKREGTGAALVIGADSSLGIQDFAPERLQHLQLAVLSACSSASARNGAFDQSNLVRSFLAGGVPAVIASRWDVDSRSTAHFMQSFYAQLHSGERVSEALQYAQAEMRSLNSHPYYWAAFTLTGRVN